MVFDKEWFSKNQRILLWFANSWIGRKILWIDGDKSSVGKNKILYIGPSWITWSEGKYRKDKRFKNKHDDRLRVYSSEFRTNDKFGRRLYFAFKPLWHLFHAFDDLIATPWVPQFDLGFDTLTQYPQSIGVNNPVDGRLFRGPVDESFGTIRAGAGSSAEAGSSVTGNDCALLRATSTTNQYQYLLRSPYCYDTSSLTSSANISDTQLGLCGEGRAPATFLGSTNLDVVAATLASTSSLAASDYGNIGTTVFATIAPGSWVATDGTYNNLTLDANGRANVSKTGVSQFAIRLAWDTVNSFTGSWVSASDTSFYAYYSKETGTSKDPKLVVTYTTSAGQVVFTYKTLTGIGL